MQALEARATKRSLGIFKTLPPCPAIAAELMRLVSQDNVSFQKVSERIASDAAFAARVLRLANSSMFARRFQVMSILHAVSMLGLDRVRALAVTVAMRDYISGVKQFDVLRRCWRHNLACALLSERLAGACSISKSLGYTGGLLHDVGRLALMAAHSADYAELLTVAEEKSLDVLTCEKELFELDHAEAGSWLMREWGFPEDFQQAARNHHLPPQEGECEIAWLVRAGCQMADMFGFQVTGEAPPDQEQRIRALLPAVAWERLQPEWDDLADELVCKINLSECDLLT